MAPWNKLFCGFIGVNLSLLSDGLWKQSVGWLCTVTYSKHCLISHKIPRGNCLGLGKWARVALIVLLRLLFPWETVCFSCPRSLGTKQSFRLLWFKPCFLRKSRLCCIDWDDFTSLTLFLLKLNLKMIRAISSFVSELNILGTEFLYYSTVINGQFNILMYTEWLVTQTVYTFSTDVQWELCVAPYAEVHETFFRGHCFLSSSTTLRVLFSSALSREIGYKTHRI